MTSPPRTKLDLDPYLEQAVLTYQSRGQSLDPMRATLLFYEGYRTLGEYRSAGTALFRAAGEVSLATQRFSPVPDLSTLISQARRDPERDPDRASRAL